MIEEIENKKTVVVELLDQINSDETLIKEKSLNAINLEADEQNKLLRIEELNKEIEQKEIKYEALKINFDNFEEELQKRKPSSPDCRMN